MSVSRGFRLPILLATAAVIASAVLPAGVAWADDAPPPPAPAPAPAAASAPASASAPDGVDQVAAATYPPASPGGVVVSTGATPIVASPDSWPVGTTNFAYRWYRGATAATATTAATGAGATTASYTPNAADWNQFLRVRITATVPGYDPVSRYSAARNLSVLSTGTISVAGTPQIGNPVTVNTAGVAYTDADGVSISNGSLTIGYQWLRNGVPITDTPAATADASDDADYTLRSLDYRASITLRVTATRPGSVARVITTPAFTPSQLGTIQASSPAVTMSNAADPSAPMHVAITATVSGVTEPELGATGYQWYRVNRTTNAATAISGATSAVYKPVSADYPYALRVVATVKKLNYTSIPLTSMTRDFALRIAGGTPLAVVGAPHPDVAVSANSPTFGAMQSTGAVLGLTYASPSMSPAFQWRRAGVNIAGATGTSYAVTPADVGKALSYTVRVEYPGFMPYTGVSPSTPATTYSGFTGGAAPHLQQNQLTLSVAPQVSDMTPAADSFTIQWYRSGVAVTGRTTTTYLLSAADVGKQVTVRITYRRAGYQPATLTSADDSTDAAHQGRFYIAAAPAAPVITGDLRVGGTIGVASRTFTRAYDDAAIAGGDLGLAYQWYRNGVAIAGATASTYTLTGSDKGKAITVRMIATDASGANALLPHTSTSAATQLIGGAALPGSNPPATPALILDGASTLYTQVLAVGSTGITSPSGTVPNVVKYQWFRGTTAISGATAAKYTLTQADRGQKVWVRVTTSHAPIGSTTYTTVVQNSTQSDFTLNGAASDIHLFTDLSVGATLVPNTPAFTDAAGAPVSGVAQMWQWYRTVGSKTTAIAGATGLFYTLQAADVGAAISVRVTTGKVGYISLIQTYKTPTPTQKVIRGTLANTGAAPSVGVGTVPTQLLATPPDVTNQAGTQHAGFTFQWYRGGVKVSGATKATYSLTAADTGKQVHVVVTAVLAGYTSATLPPSADHDYSLLKHPSDPPQLDPADPWRVGTAVHVIDLNFVDAASHLQNPDSITYQWRRTVGSTTTVVATTTTPSYTLVAADYNAKITVRLTAVKSGYIALSYITPAIPQLVRKGQDDNGWTPVVVDGPELGQVSAGVGSLGPATPAGTTSGYQWFRNGVAITGATAKTYTLVAADHDADISVRLTLARANFEPLAQPTKTGAGSKHTIYTNATTQPVISGPSAPAVGDTLTSSTPDFFLNSAQTTVLDTYGSYTFTWYRSGVAIAGVTGPSYTLVGADVGQSITVRVRAAAAGYLAADSDISAGTAAVNPGTIDAGTFGYSTKLNATTHVVTVTRTGAIATPGTTVTYTWYLYTGLPTVVSTASSYTLPSSAASNGKSYTLLITLTKPGYTPLPIYPPYGDFVNSFRGSGAPTITGTVAVGNPLTCVPPTFTRADGTVLVPGSNGSIQYAWYSDDVVVGTAATYVVAASDVGDEVRCHVVPVAPYHSRVEWGSGPVYP